MSRKNTQSENMLRHRFGKGERSWWDSKQNEYLCRSSRPKGSLKKVLWEISQNSQENICARISFLVFSWEFCEISHKTFFAEQNGTTASDYSSISSSEGNIGKVVQVKNRFQKQSFADFKLEVLKNFVNSTAKHLCWSLFLIDLKTCISIKKRLPHRCFPVKFAKFLRIYFFTEEFQWLLLRFNSCFQRSSEQKPVRLSAINTKFSWKTGFAVANVQKQPL